MNLLPELLLFLNWAYEKELPGYKRLLAVFLDVIAKCHSDQDIVRLPFPPETSSKSTPTFLSGKSFLSDATRVFPRLFSKSAMIKMSLIAGDVACTRSLCQYANLLWSDVFLVEVILGIQGGPNGVYTKN